MGSGTDFGLFCDVGCIYILNLSKKLSKLSKNLLTNPETYGILSSFPVEEQKGGVKMIKKEKNWIIFEDDCGVVQGKVDINTSTIYGKRNLPVKSPSPAMRNCMPEKRCGGRYFDLVGFEQLADSFWTLIKEKPTLLLQCDRLNNVGLKLRTFDYCEEPDLFEQMIKDKEFIEWAKNDGLGNIFFSTYKQYSINKVIERIMQNMELSIREKFHSCMHNLLFDTNDEKYCTWVVNHLILNPEYHIPEVGFVTYDWWSCTSIANYNDHNILMNYYNATKALNREWANHNFYADYARVYSEYVSLNIARDKTIFADRYRKANLSFTDGDFTIVCPMQGDDLITEGRHMHHCVGSYVNSVKEGRCFILFVRRTNAIDTPYITCEVYPNGRINQYYLAYDRSIRNDEDFKFRAALQKYLATPEVATRIKEALSM